MPNDIPTLNERAQTLLKALVERYIADGQPVGSRALSRVSGLDLSPASIRNVMADLEEMGFIASPHTSGRPHADAARLPLLRRYAAHDQAARSRRDPPARRPAAYRKPPAHRVVGLAFAVGSHALRRRGHDAAPRRDVPPDRIREPVRKAHSADHRVARRRRAKPHLHARPQLHPVGTHRGGEHAQPALRRLFVRGNPPPHPRRT